MKSKLMLLSLSMVLSVSLLAGCASKTPTTTTNSSKSTTADSTKSADSSAKTDAVTGASQVNDEAAFEQKISKDNSEYMVIVNKDLTFTKDLTVESGTKKGTDGKEAPNRSIAPAHETADNKVDKRYTITVPSLVFNGENGKVEYGAVKGDVYVQAKGFTLKDATIDGNLYFANDDLKNAFKQDATTKITGQVAVKAYTAK